MTSYSIQQIEDEIQSIKEEILKLGAIPPRFEVNDKAIDTREQFNDLRRQLQYWEKQLQLNTGESIYQGPDRELY